MIDISKAFGTSGEPVSEFFQRPGVGYYIPLYQRDYSWDSENIEQLMEDICSGVEALLTDDEVILFLGTIILVKEMNPAANIQPQDNRALPPRIDNVIDGQQRISTIALLACLLYRRIFEVKKKLPADTMYVDLQSEIRSKLLTLEDLFSVDLRRGRPARKPIIVRGSVDRWTFDGDDADNYKSDVSSFLAAFIRAVSDETEFPPIPPTQLVGGNLKLINKWLKDVEEAHEGRNDVFPPAWQIIEKISEENLWSYSRPELVELIVNRQSPMSTLEKRLCSIVQLFAFTHFFLQRCCFTLIEPVSNNWAFDMFQSLNATGTPLTAIETFKPMVVNYINSNGGGFKGSKSETYFKPVDSLLSGIRSAAQKSKLTNEYLTTLALTHDGTKLSSQFSAQRRWLDTEYSECGTVADHEEFIRRMGDLATYWSDVLGFNPNRYTVIPRTEEAPEEDRKLAALCVLYLKAANHKMANTILSRFYSQVVRGKSNAENEFVFACKVIAAFFTLWRAALPNTGLDDVYRRLLRIGETFGQMSWEGNPEALTVGNLKTSLTKELKDKGVWNKDDWMNKATQYLRYDNAKEVCRFALFVTSHDTIVDPDEPGLMKIGATGSRPYLDPAKWVADDFRSIEHIAPQRQRLTEDSLWDKELYENDDYQRIGNLTLLPIEINSSAGNKRWIDKRIYYLHLAETNPDNLAVLEKEAKDNNVVLAAETIDLLKRTPHKHHIAPIVQLTAEQQWDKALVEKRTLRMCEILWDRIRPWLE